MKLGEKLKNIPPKVKIIIAIALAAIIGLLAWHFYTEQRDKGPGEGFVSGNGRIEATEIDISAKLPGRLEQLLVGEGDYVEAGQLLAVMQLDSLEAQRREAEAQLQQAIAAKAQAEAQVLVRQSDKLTAEATVTQRASDLDAAGRRVTRTSALTPSGAVSKQEYDDDRASYQSAQAALTAARAQVSVADASIEAARADVQGAQANIEAARAAIARIDADINDSKLTAPVAGRIQYGIAQLGEVVASGGKIFNLVDLNDLHITFFLPNEAAGQVSIGQDVRLVLDSAPDYVIPCKVSYVASTAQFTPKTVETADERQKLMFRVKAHIDPQTLARNVDELKIGMPGVAWVKLDPDARWPENLSRQTIR